MAQGFGIWGHEDSFIYGIMCFEIGLLLLLVAGIATFAQGTVVQGPFCTRDISPRRLL